MFTSFHLPKYKYSDLNSEAKKRALVEAEKILMDDYKESLLLNDDLLDCELTDLVSNKRFTDSEISSRINTLSFDFGGCVV